MAGLDKEDNRYSLFKDDKELTVAVKYMIENGTYIRMYVCTIRMYCIYAI